MPKSWVEKNNLKPGDLINVDEGSADLVLSPNILEEAKKLKEIIIEVENKSLNLIKTEIVSAYLNNYNTIELIGKNLDKHVIEIKGIVRNLTGLEIMEQTSTRLVSRDLINVSDISIQNIIKRMDMITRAMIDDAILCLEKKCHYQSVEHRDADINRLYYLGFRTIKNAMNNPMVAKKLDMNMWELHSGKMIMMRIEEIADRQKRICKLFSEADLNEDTLDEFRKIKQDLRQRYHNVMKAYYNDDKKIAYNIETTNKAFIGKCNKFLETLCPECQDSEKGKTADSNISIQSTVAKAKIIEDTKATITFIKYIARTVLNID